MYIRGSSTNDCKVRSCCLRIAISCESVVIVYQRDDSRARRANGIVLLKESLVNSGIDFARRRSGESTCEGECITANEVVCSFGHVRKGCEDERIGGVGTKRLG